MTSTRFLVSLAVVLALVSGCKKAEKKPDEVVGTPDTGQTAQDSSIQNKDMSFDAQGSDSGNIEGLSSIHFDYDKANLTSEGKAIAQKNAQWLKSHSDVSLQIEGHCDRHGSIEYNLALGERRAKIVKTYMVNLGISGKRLSTISYGKERLLDSGETESADAKNRRANFVIAK